MKRFMLSLLVILMLLPGLACANIMPDQKQDTSMAGMSEDMPCCPKHKPSPDKGTMLMQDCMKVDIQQAADLPPLKKTDNTKYFYPFILPRAVTAGALSVHPQAARGPPFMAHINLSEVHIPIFLITQRLRI